MKIVSKTKIANRNAKALLVKVSCGMSFTITQLDRDYYVLDGMNADGSSIRVKGWADAIRLIETA
jgi:hypothetical protein